MEKCIYKGSDPPLDAPRRPVDPSPALDPLSDLRPASSHRGSHVRDPGASAVGSVTSPGPSQKLRPSLASRRGASAASIRLWAIVAPLNPAPAQAADPGHLSPSRGALKESAHGQSLGRRSFGLAVPRMAAVQSGGSHVRDPARYHNRHPNQNPQPRPRSVTRLLPTPARAGGLNRLTSSMVAFQDRPREHRLQHRHAIRTGRSTRPRPSRRPDRFSSNRSPSRLCVN